MRVKFIPLSTLAISAAFPFAASAATLTATQQGSVYASAPIGAQRAVFLDISLHAECDADVTVSSLDIRHRGLGESADLERVYATEGDVRLTHTRSLNASGKPSTLTFYPALAIKKCATRVIQIRGDFSAQTTASAQHGLIVDNIDAGTAGVVLSALAKTATIETKPVSAPSLRVELLGLSRAPRFGTTSVLSRIQLHGDGYKDQEVSSITLTNHGKASGTDLRDLRLRNRAGGVLTATLESLDGKRVRLVFTKPLFLKRNSTLLVELIGEVRASRSKTISFVLEEPSDVEAGEARR